MSEIHLKSNEKTLVLGVNDMGKSVLFRHLIQQYLDAGVKVLLYDSERERKYASWEHPNLRIYRPEVAADKPEFDKISAEVWERRRMVFAVESVDFYAQSTDIDLKQVPNFKKIIHWGRNRGIGVLMTSRRPANVHKDCVGLNRHIFLFHCYLPNDIKYLRGFVGKIADQLKDLPPYYFYHWSGGKVELCNPIPFEGE